MHPSDHAGCDTPGPAPAAAETDDTRSPALAGAGPLRGVRIVELAGLGAAPFAGMMLADAGADVIRVDRPSAHGAPTVVDQGADVLARGRRSIAVNLKQPAGVDLVLRLCATADGLIEGFRPGVTERLGLGPAACLARNPALVYGRMTGWGQDGPWAAMAGHDIDYIALAGALHPVGPPDGPPAVPINYVGDFGGGGMLLAFGVVCALLHARATGEGQVVDAAMVDGVAAQTAMLHGLRAAGLWADERGSNVLDGAAPFYRTYACADGRHVAVGALEPQFHAALIAGLGLDPADFPQHDRMGWSEQSRRLAEVFAQRGRDAWMEIFAGTDACVAPVLDLGEAPNHPHHRARAAFVESGGVVQPAPAPRFTATPSSLSHLPPAAGRDTAAILAELGIDEAGAARLRADGIVI